MSNNDTAQLGAPSRSGSEDAAFQALSFVLGPQIYALEVACIYEVARMVAITDLPDSPPDILGVVDYRGTVVPIINLRVRFNLESLEHTLTTPIIIAWTGQHAVGLVVDEIQEVRALAPGDIMAPEDFGYRQGVIAGVATVKEGLLLIMNPARLLSDDIAQHIQDAASE